MKNPYAELTFYFGCCPSDGFREIDFDGYKSDPKLADIRVQAMHKIDRYVSQNWLRIFDDCPLMSEPEAQRFISKVEGKIKGSYGVIDPKSSYHGVLSFSRRMRVPGFNSQKQTELIRLLKECDAIICDPRGTHELMFTLINKLERAEKEQLISREEANKEYLRRMKDPDIAWINALRFFD